MFKILLLETWYGLSDYVVEERINGSLLFSEFLNLDFGVAAPDHSTISRFHLEITRLGIMDKLLGELYKQFEKHGISHINQGALVDASIVDSLHAPDGRIVIEVAEDREDVRSEDAHSQEEAYHCVLKSKKPGMNSEARWVCKDKAYRYGYKKHVLPDEQGLVEAVITTAANCADTVVLPDLMEKAELVLGVQLLADKGYSSKRNSKYLSRYGIIDGIMFKAQRGQAFSGAQKAFNRAVSRYRSLITPIRDKQCLFSP